jgi:iron(III) transport system ATP-binding protein
MLNTAQGGRNPSAEAPGAVPVGTRPEGGGARTVGGGTPAGVLVAGLTKSFDGVRVLDGVDLRVEPGSLVALLGPSGCGKTTLLRMLAGLEHPDAGTVTVDDRVLAGPGAFVPPERRPIALVFQDWALFPHMNVADNIGYGLARGSERAGRIDAALAMVGLDGLGSRMPGTLSGGQQQRVALARAVATEPSILLLDEPFSNLDTTLRVQVRTEVHELLVELGITTVVVTHDQDEAFVLGDQVAVMNGGRIVQQDTPAGVYANPASPWVAGFVGDANLVPGTVSAIDGSPVAHTSFGPVALRSVPADGSTGSVEVLVRPEECRIAPGDGGRVELVEFYGHDTVYVVGLNGGGRVRVREGAAPTAQRGDQVEVIYVGGPTLAYPAS